MRFPLPASCLLAILALALTSWLAEFPRVAQAQESLPPPNPGQVGAYDEKEAQHIDRMLMCPVCPAETIDQAQVELARQMRRMVRDMLARGATRQEILGFFADRYGPGVLAAPPKSGVNLVAWIVPLVGVLMALGAGALVIRAMAGDRGGGADAQPVGDGELAPYLAVVDRDLGISGTGAAPGTGHGPGGPRGDRRGRSGPGPRTGPPDTPVEE